MVFIFSKVCLFIWKASLWRKWKWEGRGKRKTIFHLLFYSPLTAMARAGPRWSQALGTPLRYATWLQGPKYLGLLLLLSQEHQQAAWLEPPLTRDVSVTGALTGYATMSLWSSHFFLAKVANSNIYIYLCMYAHTHTYTHVHMYLCMYTYVYTYIETQITHMSHCIHLLAHYQVPRKIYIHIIRSINIFFLYSRRRLRLC